MSTTGLPDPNNINIYDPQVKAYLRANQAKTYEEKRDRAREGYARSGWHWDEERWKANCAEDRRVMKRAAWKCRFLALAYEIRDLFGSLFDFSTRVGMYSDNPEVRRDSVTWQATKFATQQAARAEERHQEDRADFDLLATKIGNATADAIAERARQERAQRKLWVPGQD